MKEVSAQEHEIDVHLLRRLQHLLKIPKGVIAQDGVLLGVALDVHRVSLGDAAKGDVRDGCRSKSTRAADLDRPLLKWGGVQSRRRATLSCDVTGQSETCVNECLDGAARQRSER